MNDPFVPRRVLVTGGAGFIGSAFVRLLFEEGVPEVHVLDALTYAGNDSTLADVAHLSGYRFMHGDIRNPEQVDAAVAGCDVVVNFAAETHVDRSLFDPASFVQTNVAGTFNLLESARVHNIRRFVQVSTDEVYGDVSDGYSSEADRLHPRSPYSASKAGAEMMVIAYAETHGLQAIITRGSNTYGPYQYPEKFIPLMITNAIEGKPLPIYGDGLQVRDWIHVRDHCQGIYTALLRGEAGAAYNVGGGQERLNIEIARLIVRELGAPETLLQHFTDRLGHDRRYALDTQRLRHLGWTPSIPFERGILDTIEWYRARRDWWEPLKQATFNTYYQRNYGHRTLAPAGVMAGNAGSDDD